MGCLVQHDIGRAAGFRQCLDRADLAAGHFPRHRPEPAGARKRQLSAVDADGLLGGDRGARPPARAPRRHLRPGAHLQPRFRDFHGRRDCVVVRPVSPRRRRGVADLLARHPGHRRGHADGLFGGHPDGRVPQQAARHGAGGQPGRRHRRPVSGSADRRTAVGMGLARSFLGRRTAGRGRDGVEFPLAA